MKFLYKKISFWLCVIALFNIAILTIWTRTKTNRPSIDYVNSEISSMQDIGLLSGFMKNLIIENGKTGEWDEHIREIGNVIYYPKRNQYIFFYSGYKGEYEQNNVYIGFAISDDGTRWQKKGRAILEAAEDPYAVIFQDKVYLFFEDKEEVPFRRISLAMSKDIENWDILKRGVLNPQGDSGWQSMDVSSPVVLKQNEKWIMIYEGRGNGCWGAVGYAVSENLVDWSQKDKPVFEGKSDFWHPTWDEYIVPDDIIYSNDKFFLTYHGSSKKNGWQSGLAVSSDLMNWSRLNDYPIHSSDTIMFMRKKNELLFLSVFKETKAIRSMKPLRVFVKAAL